MLENTPSTAIRPALNIQGTVERVVDADPNDLVDLPLEGVAVARAIQVLQVQIMDIADALAELAQAVHELDGRSR